MRLSQPQRCDVAGRVARRPSSPAAQSKPAGVAVPKLNRNPVLSLRPWPVIITVGGEEFTIPALPAADWLAALMSEAFSLDDLFPGLLDDEDHDRATVAIMDNFHEMDQFSKLTLDIVELASGRSWWVALRLIGAAVGSWDVIGAELILKQVDPERLSLAAWLDAALLVMLRNMEDKDITMFLLKLEAPPPEAQEEAEEMTMSREAFTSMM